MRFLRDYPARLVQLDFLRGVAIILVIGHHPALDTAQAGLVAPIGVAWYRLQGVDFFMVLSGFLVGGLLFRELQKSGKVDVVRFLIRRAFKIWPAYLLFLFLPVLVPIAKLVLLSQGTWAGIATEYAGYMAPSLLMLQNYLGSMPGRGHTWTIAVLWHLYLILALLFAWLTRGKNRIAWIPVISFGVALACLSLRIAHWDPDFYEPTHLRLDAPFFGVLLAYVYNFQPEMREWFAQRRLLLGVLGVLLLTPMLFLDVTDPFVWTIGYTLYYLGYGAILLSVVCRPAGVEPTSRIWNTAIVRLVAWVGYFSYTIYLWHLDFGQLPVQKLLILGLFNGAAPEIRWTATELLYVVLACVTGSIMGMLVEKPGLYLRERLFPARASTVATENEEVGPVLASPGPK